MDDNKLKQKILLELLNGTDPLEKVRLDDFYKRFDYYSELCPELLDPDCGIEKAIEILYDRGELSLHEITQDSFDLPFDISDYYSRYYESKSRGKQLLDGSYVGFMYYYGGGKHGEPPEPDNFVFLDVTYETRVVAEFKIKA